MYWNLESIELKNFISHIDTKINFINNKVTCIYGINKDNEGANSNGTGKSSIAEAIVVALTGSSHRDTPQDELIRDGENDAYIKLIMHHAAFNEEVQIERFFKRGKSQKATLTINGVKKENITSVTEVAEVVLNYLNISKEDLLNYYIIGQFNDHSFLTSSDTTKKRIINRFIKIELIEKAYEIAKKQSASIVKDIEEYNADIERVKKEIVALEERIQLEQELVKNRQQELIDSYEKRIIQLGEAAFECEEGAAKWVGLIEEETEKLLTYKTIEEIAKEKLDLDQTGSRLNIDLKAINLELKDWESLLREKEKILLGIIECPHCKESFHPSQEHEHDDLETLELDIKALKINIIEGKKNGEIAKALLDVAKDKAEELEEQSFQRGKIEKKITQYEEFLDRAARQIYMITCDIGKLESKKEEALQAPQKSNADILKGLKDKIAKLKEQNKVSLSELEIKEEEQIQLNKTMIHLSTSGFQTFLANKAIAHIEEFINYYLKSFATDLYIKINGYSVTQQGKVRDKIDILVGRGISKLVSINRLSGGEKNRLQLACIFALQKLINLSSTSGGLNFLLLDETFIHLDRLGQVELLKCLVNSDQTVFSISNIQDFINSYDELNRSINSVVLCKEKGVTCIITE